MTDEPLQPDFDALDRRREHILASTSAKCIGGPLDGQAVSLSPDDQVHGAVWTSSRPRHRYRLEQRESGKWELIFVPAE